MVKKKKWKKIGVVVFSFILSVALISGAVLLIQRVKKQAQIQAVSTTIKGESVETTMEDKYRSFYIAIENGQVELLKTLLTSKGFNINYQRPLDQRTGIVHATKLNQKKVVAFLLDNGADPNIQDSLKDNVYLYASASGYLDILQMVVQHQVDYNRYNRFGGTGLIPASERAHVDVVMFLLKNTPIDINHINRLSWTALIEAVLLGEDKPAWAQVVRLLLSHGADYKIKTNKNQTAYAIALERQMTKHILPVFFQFKISE